MRLLIATDAAPPQVNGVVRTYDHLLRELDKIGVESVFITPNEFRSFPFPFYPEIRLALPNFKRARHLVEEAKADCIHIATEGPIGLMVRRYCQKNDIAYTTSYHTKFPEYLSTLSRLPANWFYRPIRRFHNTGAGTMVATRSLSAELAKRGFKHLLPWTRGVDNELFKPRSIRLFGNEKPVFLYVGRVSKEKNIEAFLDACLPGQKVVVGDGPLLAALRQQYKDVLFVGRKEGTDLAQAYASADVFVFPSRTDTFGLVLLEAMASGLPVAAYPVTGPIDLVDEGVSGALDDDLAEAAIRALKIDREGVRAFACSFSWLNAATMFLDNIKSAKRQAMKNKCANSNRLKQAVNRRVR